MKLPSIIIAAALLSAAGFASAQNSVKLTWDPSPPGEGVTGYRVYQRVTTPAPEPPAGTPPPATPPAPVVTWKLVATVPVTATPATPVYIVSGLAFGAVNAWAVTAFNPWGESSRSKEVAHKVPISPPLNVKAERFIP